MDWKELDFIEKFEIIALIVTFVVKVLLILVILYFIICYANVVINNLDSSWNCPSWNLFHNFK